MADALTDALRDAVGRSKSPGAVAFVGRRDETVFHEACGARQIVPVERPAERDTPYDLASLTKVIATTTAVMLLHEAGSIELDAPASKYLPIPAFGRFTIRHCLTHTTGLPAGPPPACHLECSSMNEMLQRCASLDSSWTPGTRRRYSDIEFMILGKVVELVAGDSLDAFCAKRIFKPLGMTRTAFKPPRDWADTCAATEDSGWRKKVIVGEVHDENAYAVGGVSGHAGLFSTAEDLARFSRALLDGKVLKEETLAAMSRVGQLPFYPWQGLGWKMDPWSSGSEGFLPSRRAIGHTGWTGTCIWIDLETGLFAILLANTCHPSRSKRDTGLLRTVFHKAVARELYPDGTNTHSGLDRLLWDGFEGVKGKHVALLTNRAAVDQLNRPILDVFALEPANDVRMVYTPEHGFSAQAEAGARIKSERGATPIISLYGDQKRPSAEDLARIDLFVVDLQDVGSRYYTYMATMRECIQACADAGKPVLVLDRPNPIGGEILEGPVATRYGSITCCAPITARHGMTMGELALFFAKTLPGKRKASVAVNELDAWPPALFHGQCSLPWTPPSPNIPTPETALLYAGMCLFEATNMNEGRGTDMPFYVAGAPWLDARAVIESLTQDDRRGCSLHPITYTPRSIPGKASSPQYCDKECKGIRIFVDDPKSVRAFTLAVALLVAIRRRHPNELTLSGGIDTLAGTPDLRAQIERSVSASEIVRGYTDELAAFDKARPRRYGLPDEV